MYPSVLQQLHGFFFLPIIYSSISEGLVYSTNPSSKVFLNNNPAVFSAFKPKRKAAPKSAAMVEVTRFELATPSSRTMCATKLRYTSKKIAPIYIEAVWLRNRDSNPNKQSQSLSCYRYTIPQNLLHLVCNVNYYTLKLLICQY